MAGIMDLFNETVKFQAGDSILKEGDTSRDIYALTDGTIEISMRDDKGNYILDQMHPPDLLGEISFLEGSPRGATAIAKTDVEVCILRYEEVKKELQGIPAWIKLIIKSFTKRIKVCNNRIKQLETEVDRLKAELEYATTHYRL